MVARSHKQAGSSLSLLFALVASASRSNTISRLFAASQSADLRHDRVSLLSLRERELALRERELALRERELALREQELRLLSVSSVGAGRTGPFNVQTFGAVADDGKDDTLSIQAALDAAVVHGGVVYIPSGIYDITGLRLQSDHGGESAGGLRSVRVVGDGRSSVLRMLKPPAAERAAEYIMLDYQVSLCLFVSLSRRCSPRNATIWTLGIDTAAFRVDAGVPWWRRALAV